MSRSTNWPPSWEITSVGSTWCLKLKRQNSHNNDFKFKCHRKSYGMATRYRYAESSRTFTTRHRRDRECSLVRASQKSICSLRTTTSITHPDRNYSNCYPSHPSKFMTKELTLRKILTTSQEGKRKSNSSWTIISWWREEMCILAKASSWSMSYREPI